MCTMLCVGFSNLWSEFGVLYWGSYAGTIILCVLLSVSAGKLRLSEV